MMSAWIDQIFRPGQANKGGIVRRSLAAVRKHGGIKALLAEAKKRNFHLARTGNQYVVLCHTVG
jgi:hypothetical protein